MIVTILYCLTMAWDAAPGPICTYSLTLDETVIQTEIAEAQASVCLQDTDTHTVTVQAFDCDGNAGPMSDESDLIQMIVQPPFYAVELPVAIRADLTNNGVVGMSDFGEFSAVFGCKNDGLGNVVSCP